MLGFLGFLIAYNAVYFINDLIDYKEDKKNKINSYKPLVRGAITHKEAKFYAFISASIGISLSFLVNSFFGFLVLSLILLNILHSFLRKKINFKISNLLLIQFVKYSTGWFALSLTLVNFPFWIILSLSLVYIFSYFMYKNDVMLRVTIKRGKIFFIILLGSCIISYIISLLVSPFKLPLILIFFILPIFILWSFEFKSKFKRIRIGEFYSHFALLIFILLFLLLINPTVAEVNEKISENFDEIKTNITEVTPPQIIKTIDKIEKTIISNLESTIHNVSRFFCISFKP